MSVTAVFKNAGLQPVSVELGEVELKEIPSKITMENLAGSLKSLGFEIIDDKKVQTIEKIKNAIISMVHHTGQISKQTFLIILPACCTRIIII